VVKARVLANNPASVRVLEKSGFTVIEHTQSVVERHRGKPLLVLSWSAAP
jgi:RimJ/RimL family protein N-acetyltransferase